MNALGVSALIVELEGVIEGMNELRGKAGNAAAEERRLAVAITNAETALLWLRFILIGRPS